ncbi:MAG: SPOR domain-containing protein [Nitrospirae bacterium]|nr:SPOR domain-containing protein [Nitrospirota bacterium]
MKDTGKMKVVRTLCLICLLVFTFSLTPGLSFSENRKSDENIAFNFIDVDIPTIIKFISEITGNNFIFDDKVKGKITIIAPAKLSIDESFSLFTSVLGLKGYTIIPSGPKTYKIILASQAKEEGQLSTDEKIPVNEGYITKLIPTQNIKADDAIQFLRPVVSRDGHISAFGPGNFLLVVDSALNMEKVMSILKLIDLPSAQEETAKVSVYFLENADAVTLAKVLEGILKNLQTAYKASQRDKQKSPDSVPTLSVTPDKSTNSLVVVAPPSEYENIAQVIKTLDRRRKQVYVEAMIVEASIDKLKELGSKWRATVSHNGEPIVIGGFGNLSSSSLVSIVNGLTGFTAGGMGNFIDIPISSIDSSGAATSTTLTAPGFAALFNLNEFKDAVNVLSTPQILTSDNEEAEILVGENVPFISKRERDVTTTNTVLNSIERQDVGIMLKITPQITEGDYVRLDIKQEISAVKDTSEAVLTTVGPTTTKRSTKTSVVVRDGRTVVISGLMQEKEEESVTKMPLLGDIPVLGWLFKTTSVTKNKTNLLVFLSPHVVKDSDQLIKITDEKHKTFVEREKFYHVGELLVRFKDDVSKERALEIIAQKRASVIAYLKDINVYHIQLKSGQEVEGALKEFSSMPEVLYAEPNYRIKITNPPLDSDTMQKEKPAVPQESKAAPQDQEQKTVPEQTIEPVIDNAAVPPAKSQTENNTEIAVPPADTPAPTEKKTLNTEKPAPETTPSGKYFIQIGSWKDIRNAQGVLEKLKGDYPEAFIVEENNFNKVRVPGIMSKEQGLLIAKEIKKKLNVKPLLVRKKI